jgi:cadmium resistance transport/sequestration family protein
VDATFRHQHIVCGQYLGFTVLVIASLPGFFGGAIAPREWIGLLGILPIIIGIKQLLNREAETPEIQDYSASSDRGQSFLFSILNPQIYKVAGVTVANGSDNISIYIPLFAGSNIVQLGVTLGVFFVMVGIWCAVAFLLTRQPTIAAVLSRYGGYIVPFVFIGLGLWIMYERGTFNLIGSLFINRITISR